MLPLFPYDMRTNIFKHGLLHITSNSVVDLVAAILAFALAGEIDWTAPDCLRWFLYDVAYVTIVCVPEWLANSLKRALRGYLLPGTEHAKVVPRFVVVFRDVGMSREFF